MNAQEARDLQHKNLLNSTEFQSVLNLINIHINVHKSDKPYVTYLGKLNSYDIQQLEILGYTIEKYPVNRVNPNPSYKISW